MLAVPCAGPVAMVGAPKVPPGLPGPSFTFTLMTVAAGVVGLPVVVAKSGLATGGFVVTAGSSTVIVNVCVVQYVGGAGAQTGTLYTYTPGVALLKVNVPLLFTVSVGAEPPGELAGDGAGP